MRSDALYWRLGLATFVALLMLGAGFPCHAMAQELGRGVNAVEGFDERATLPSEAPRRQPWPPQLTQAPLYAVGIETVGGLTMPAESHVQSSHAFGGGLLRLRLRNVQAGGTYLLTDSTRGVGGEVPQGDNEWRSVGGFLGAWLPYDRWVDVDAAAGVGRRTYAVIGPRFGGGIRTVTLTELSLRVGVSARTSEALLGARVGAAITASLDLDRPSLPWRYELETPEGLIVRTGRTPLGGFNFGMLVTVGIEVAEPVAKRK